MTVLEVAANAFNAASIVLAARNSVGSWWPALVGCALFAVLFYQSRLYADVVLQAFFIGTCVFGWWRWHRGAHGDPLPVTHCPSVQFLLGILAAGLVAFGYGTVLAHDTNAYSPFWDSMVLAFSVLSPLMMMQRRYESRSGWLAVNSVNAPLYLSRGLLLTAVLYAGFWINALVALVIWRKPIVRPLTAGYA